jgi:hypothetical protein
MIKPAASYRPLAYSSPEAVQITGTSAVRLVVGLACTLVFLAIAFYRVQFGAVGAALAE